MQMQIQMQAQMQNASAKASLKIDIKCKSDFYSDLGQIGNSFLRFFTNYFSCRAATSNGLLAH